MPSVHASRQFYSDSRLAASSEMHQIQPAQINGGAVRIMRGRGITRRFI